MDQRAKDGKNPYEGAMYTREVGKLEEDQTKTCFPESLQRRKDIKDLVRMEATRTSFTYIIIAGLKPHVIKQLDQKGKLKLLSEYWARTYYYYLDFEGSRYVFSPPPRKRKTLSPPRLLFRTLSLSRSLSPFLSPLSCLQTCRP